MQPSHLSDSIHPLIHAFTYPFNKYFMSRPKGQALSWELGNILMIRQIRIQPLKS